MADALFGVNPHIYSKMSINPMKIRAGRPLISNQLILAANPTVVPATIFRPSSSWRGAAVLPSIGNGSMHHLAMELPAAAPRSI